MPSLARASCRSQAPSHSPASLECVSPRRIRDKAPVTARARLAAPGARPRPAAPAALLLRREGRKQEIARLFKVMSHEDLVASDIDHDGRVDEAEFVLL